MRTKISLTSALLLIAAIVIIVIFLNHSSPEKVVNHKLRNASFEYTIVKDDFIDQVYGQRYYIKETDGKFHSDFPHIFYLNSNWFGWFIKSTGNAP
ncbi:hypothetical protein [Paenibacillus alginolyticus]|uniref:DUF3139 domain-containing protein n=1 Tax=Paenibacillus alginolyticus TaxID=59839 RepID=A0ABT4GIQ5_9BACL|nr:hypothetical protein [Paenibacillus alginolyticus]MCY9696089.1 hypothetical protein [Paenibacillus alginolyticus]MEC0143368.1 hypothetical protein [Paenibacillus alginolyticus]